ncbi:MAG: hypothetical protein AB7U73_23585 [Pirellulales bacterium]
MPITVFCQECGKQYLAKEEQAGMRVRCPAGHIMQVPAASPFEGQAPIDPSGGDPTQINPYASPGFQAGGHPAGATFTKGKVMAPAIGLLVVGSVGLCAAIFSCVWSMVATPPPVDPNMPPMVQQFMQGGFGPMALAIQAIFLVLNGLIIAGGIQMLRLKAYTLAMTATILAMINVGNCCCLVGVPIGIWGLVILLQNDVKAAFLQQSHG